MNSGVMDEVELARLRREYEAVGLVEADLPGDPLALFHDWLDCAAEAKLAEVNAMVLTTVDEAGVPSSRMVLCKAVDAQGFVFFTNYESRKAGEIESSPQVALLFPWHPLGRQVRVEGTAARVSRAESEAYFAGRPRGAQLSAWASAQSSAVADRDALEQRMAEVTAAYDGRDVPCPPHWGGIRVAPQVIEFWQGRADRLHDRLVYRRDGDGWSVVRLSP
jgi:pyridoxamine 5'-phosphate oxidase